MPDESPRVKSGLRFQVINAFCDRGLAEAGVRGAPGIVWFMLWRHADADNRACVSIETLIESTGYDESTIKRALRTLKERRMVKTLKRGGIGRGPSVYVISPWPAPTKPKK